MKLKVKKTFFDKKEDRYIYPEKEPTIERPKERAKVLIDAGVVEECELEAEAPTTPDAENAVPAEETIEEPKPKKGTKAKKTE